MRAISLLLFLFFVFNGSESCLVVKIVQLCTPLTNTTYLFAYSNDIEEATVEYIVKILTFRDVATKISKFANVRFDVQYQEEIEYHNSADDMKTSISQKLPNPEKGFKSEDIGSDIITVLNRFLNNTQAPVCGSRISIILKRNPDIANINPIVSLLKKNRVSIYVISSNAPLGKRNSTDMYKIATQTNGLAFQHNDASFFNAFWDMFSFSTDFNVYAAQFNVSSRGTINLKQITLLFPIQLFIVFSVYDHPQPRTLQSLRLNWTHAMTGVAGSYLASIKDIEEISGNYDYDLKTFSEGTYNLTISYEYNDDIMRQLYIRFYTLDGQTVDYWVPYDN